MFQIPMFSCKQQHSTSCAGFTVITLLSKTRIRPKNSLLINMFFPLTKSFCLQN